MGVDAVGLALSIGGSVFRGSATLRAFHCALGGLVGHVLTRAGDIVALCSTAYIQLAWSGNNQHAFKSQEEGGGVDINCTYIQKHT